MPASQATNSAADDDDLADERRPFFGLRWSTSTPMTMRSSAPASTGVATIRPFCAVRQAEVVGDLHAQRAEHDPDHEGQVEIEESGEQRRRMAGFEKECSVHRWSPVGVGGQAGWAMALCALMGKLAA